MFLLLLWSTVGCYRQQIVCHTVCAEPGSQTPGRNSGSWSDQGASSDAWSRRDTALPLCEIRAALLRFKPGMTGEKRRHTHTNTNVRSSTEYHFKQMLWTGRNKTTKRNELKASRSGFFFIRCANCSAALTAYAPTCSGYVERKMENLSFAGQCREAEKNISSAVDEPLTMCEVLCW